MTTNCAIVRRKRILFSAALFSKQFLELLTYYVLTYENDNYDDDDELENIFTIANIRRIKGRRKKPTRILRYVEYTIPRYSSRQFREHFRMVPETYANLENRLGRLITDPDVGHPMIPIRKQLLATIWILSTPDSYRSVAKKFDMSKGSLHTCVYRIVDCLNRIASEIITWPKNQKLRDVKEDFMRVGNALLPGVIGAIDGTYMFTKKPNLEEMALHYKSRKGRYAVVLQAICDANLCFTDCYTGYPGSVGDLRIFRNSDFYKKARRNIQNFFPDDEYIIGDKVYPTLTWCIPPFRDNGRLTAQQKRFNTRLSEKRQVIERTFALLKGRFRRLKFLDMTDLKMIPFFIMASCVLHNICLQGIEDYVDDFIAEGMESQEPSDDEEEDAEHSEERDAENFEEEDADGQLFRDSLCIRC